MEHDEHRAKGTRARRARARNKTARKEGRSVSVYGRDREPLSACETKSQVHRGPSADERQRAATPESYATTRGLRTEMPVGATRDNENDRSCKTIRERHETCVA